MERIYVMNNTQTTSINILVSSILESRLKEVAKLSQKSEQKLIIEAVENYLKQFSSPKNCYALAKELGIIGIKLIISLTSSSKSLDSYRSPQLGYYLRF